MYQQKLLVAQVRLEDDQILQIFGNIGNRKHGRRYSRQPITP